MIVNKKTKPTRSLRRKISKIFIILVVIVSVTLIGARIWYSHSTSALTSESRIVTVDIPENSSLDDIAAQLEKEGVIRNARAFKLYTRFHKSATSLKFGVYDLNSGDSVAGIVKVLVGGQEVSELFTIPPGLRLDQVRARFIKAGYSEEEVDAALEPTQYEDYPALLFKPKGASLEGYLYPESFQKTSNTTAKSLVELSLNEMAKRLDSEMVADLKAQGVTPHEAIILSSIIEKEVHSAEDRRVVAQIFLKRLKEGTELGSDVTYEYAAVVHGGIASPSLDDPYNTRLYSGLPPGPIANFDETALLAIANPAGTDYLFFLSGDDDKTYYGNNLAEHDANIREHCQQKCK